MEETEESQHASISFDEIAEEAENIQEVSSNLEDEDIQDSNTTNEIQSEEEDDFGSFDEASFDEFQAEEPPSSPIQSHAVFSSAVFKDENLIDQRVQETLDQIFTSPEPQARPETIDLLRDGAAEDFSMLSKIPYLSPPNWTRSNIRHRLLVHLGIPIDLDELEKGSVSQMSHHVSHQRKKSISEHDIDWTGFVIPEMEALKLDEEKKQHLISQTSSILDSIEAFNLQNTSHLFLETSSDEALDEKLNKMKENYEHLLELSAVWQDQIKELKNSQEMYESVVQNMVGYSQKLRRNEIMVNLGRKKSKKGKRSF